MRLAAGARLGPYEVVGVLGAGGMGEVYRARDSRLHREVAVKILQESAGDEAWERFQREARAASSLSHPHICAVYDVGESDGKAFLVMELLEGRTLHDVISTGPTDPATAIQLGIQIAEALEAAHAKGVIHRDIKPHNIMISGRSHVKVLDFGLARHAGVTEADRTALHSLTQTGLVLGTPHYMAPELLLGQPADARSDLWALGVVLYQMVSGQLPFEGSTPFELASAVLRETARPLASTVPAGLQALIARTLSKRPEDRFQRAGDIRDALEALHAASIARPERDAPQSLLGGKPSLNQEANDAFLLAMQFLRVQNDLDRGQKQLERALELDPHFAQARRYHAFNRLVQIVNGYSNDSSLLYAVEEELRQAERDDPTLPSLPSAFAATYLAQGRQEMIPTAALERACSQGSAAREAFLWRAIIAAQTGANTIAKEFCRRSIALEPLFGAPRMILGEILRTEGDVDGAIREQLRVLEQAPDNVSAIRWLALAYLDAGDPAKARAVLEGKRQMFERNYLWRGTWALVLACEGKRTEALEAMDGETLKFARFVFIATLDVAEFYAVLGEVSPAIEWIEVAVRNGNERLDWFRRSPRLAVLQDDLRFQRILQSIEARRKNQ